MSRPLIAILRGVHPGEVIGIAEAILAAGIDRIEVPLNSPDPYTSIVRLVETMGARASIGAGTVLDAEHVRRVADAGGQLIVSPDCNPEVIDATREAGMASFPGVLTPSECFTALRHGANGLKFFPASVLGPAGIAALRAVLPPDTQTFAVGGADAHNFADWLQAGVTGFGIGSALYKPGRQAEEVGVRALALVEAFDDAIASLA